jgi:hypothetical protein
MIVTFAKTFSGLIVILATSQNSFKKRKEKNTGLNSKHP